MFAKAQLHFKKVDPFLYQASLKLDPPLIEKSTDYFLSLTREIVGQQLSGKVVDVIFARFRNLFPDQKPTPEVLKELTEEKLRSAGLSGAKTRSLKDLAEKVSIGELQLDKIDNLSNLQVQEALIKVKGIGPWTSEMFLMFALGREDIFSFGDLGLQNAIKKIYSLKEKPTSEEMKTLSEKWSPYRTWAALILWDTLDNRPA